MAIGLALWLLGVPLLVPLVGLVLLASFAHVRVGTFVTLLAVLVALVTKGWIAAAIMLGVLIVLHQTEIHFLQPMVVGRPVRLYPLVIVLAVAIGALFAGVTGAIIAVPATAAVVSAWPHLREREDQVLQR